MSPTYTMSSHLSKQFKASWSQSRQGRPEPLAGAGLVTAAPGSRAGSNAKDAQRAPSPTEKRSMDSDRSDSASAPPPALSRSGSDSAWPWGCSR